MCYDVVDCCGQKRDEDVGLKGERRKAKMVLYLLNCGDETHRISKYGSILGLRLLVEIVRITKSTVQVS